MTCTKTIHIALEQFDALPDSAYVRQPVVLGLFSCSKATLWRWVKNSRVPSPKKLGSRISAWNVGQLRQALQEFQFPEGAYVECQDEAPAVVPRIHGGVL